MIQSIADYVRLMHHQKTYSPHQIEKYQLKSLQRIVGYAIRKSPFYEKTLGSQPFSTFDEFHKLPSINKAVMMEHFSTLNTCGLPLDEVKKYALEKERNKDYLGYYQNRYVIGLSSGTSGNKGIFITPKSMTRRLPAVFLARSGLRLKDLPMRILFCLRVFSQGFNDINAPFMKLHYMSTMTPVEELIQVINDKNINILMAPPSLIRILLPYHHEIKVKFKKIVTYAEVLFKEDQARFEEAFKTKVIEIYQASEGQIASACRLGNLHLNEDMVYVEIYDEDGRLVREPHVTGHKMIVTNLVNFAQPLIRYEMNDMIVLDEPCPCGSHFRTVKKILGRQDDLLYFYDENHQRQVVFPDLFSRWIITETDAIREFQVIQTEIGTIRIMIDTDDVTSKKALEDRIRQELKLLDLDGTIDIEIKKITVPKDSKYKRFISEISKTDLS